MKCMEVMRGLIGEVRGNAGIRSTESEEIRLVEVRENELRGSRGSAGRG